MKLSRHFSCLIGVSVILGVLLALSATVFASGVPSNKIALSDACANLLVPSHAVISTLKDLLEQGVLTKQDLVTIRNGENPLLYRHGVNEQIFSRVVAATIVHLKQNPDVHTKLNRLIRNTEKQIDEQNAEVLNAIQTFAAMKMHYIPGGTFSMGDSTIKHLPPVYQATVESFYAADMPVTQWQYAMVYHSNPSYFQTGPGASNVLVDGKSISMRPNNPVEGVSLDFAKEYIRVLNQWSIENNPLIYKIISNHIEHAHIRLLTDTEWEFLIRNRGEWLGSYSEGITEQNINQYSWNINNSPGSTQPVAERQPLVIRGHPFYDLLGNVWEWVGPGKVGFCLRGGCWKYETECMRAAYKLHIGHEKSQNDVGFRLAEDPP